MKATLIIIIALLYSLLSSGQEQYVRIDNFEIKESLTANGKVAIVATDSLDKADEGINGTFKFTINGFENTLAFHNGVAIPSHPIDGSTFVYFKHKNQDKSIGKLYFLYKKGDEITPFKINGLLLILIPVILLAIAYVLKRFLSTFVVLAIIYAYFSFSKGLSIAQILESAIEVIKKII